MPFARVDVLESRLSLVRAVLSEGESVSGACRAAGISRTTGYKWLGRYVEEECLGLVDRSRRPSASPHRTPAEVEERVLELKRLHPYWGARKLASLLGEGSPCARTIDRILSRHGLCQAASQARSVGRFEREGANELWQIDFKGVPKGAPNLLGGVDDASRFCVLLEPVSGQSLEDIWGALWDAFGEYGLPEAVLSDNGPAFRCLATPRWSAFDVRLLRLGIRPVHGRPGHPQTQGKIERFFGTLEREQGMQEPEAFRERYNELRPHEAIGMLTPAQRYAPSPRKRPERMPPLDLPEGCEARRTDHKGIFSYKGVSYKLGRGLANSTIGVRDGLVHFGTATLGTLEQYELSTMSCRIVSTMS
jgi:transposase InsO family protein